MLVSFKYLAIAGALLAPMAAHAAPALYPGEVMTEAAGQPAMIRFIPGDPKKPLIVFVPGTSHSARIAYGGHEGARDEDFLAHWLNEAGYNFLGITYPIATQDAIFEEAHPDFTVTEWGRQTMEIAGRTVAENGIEGGIVVAGWSMAGKIPNALFEGAVETGVPLDWYASLSATAALPGLTALDRRFDILESGYTDRRKNRDGWYKDIAANGEGLDHEIIPQDIYNRQYAGDISVNQEGSIQRYVDGGVTEDWVNGFEDNGAFRYDAYPLIGMLVTDDRRDARHALNDMAVWNFYNSQTIAGRMVKEAGADIKTMPDENWASLIDMARHSTEDLSVEIEGNHFFFVGEPGAKAAAEALGELDKKVTAFQERLTEVLEP